MRWKITNTNTVVGGERIRNTNKKLYVTVGDIVGMGKSASAAVKNAITNVKTLINGLRQDPALMGQVAGATLVQNLLNPLYVAVKGTEVYQKLMAVANVVTPAVKLIARGTGVWCSPGNAADIGQIVLGVVNEILVGLITSIIVKLKNWIWNYEFLIKDINSMSSEAITNLIAKLSTQLQVEVKNIFGSGTTLTPWMSGSTLTPGSANWVVVEECKKAETELKSKYNNKSRIVLPLGTAQAISNILQSGSGSGGSSSGLQKQHHGPYWVSEYEVPNSPKAGVRRYFRGSLSNKGIQYSDDGGITWQQSEQRIKSFSCFAKINIGTEANPQYRYLAGSVPYIAESNLKSIDEETWQKGTHGQYNKDYYKFDFTESKAEKYSKFEKDSNDKYYYIANEKNGCYDATGYIRGDGVYRSDDNGIHWIKCNCSDFENIGKLWEFKQKVGEPTRVVACDYNYGGVWYTENGNTFTRSQVRRSGTGNLENIVYGRWTEIKDYDNNKIHIHTADLNSSTLIREPIVHTLVHINSEPASSAAVFKPATIIDKIEEFYGNTWRQIRRLIHQDYDVESSFYSAAFWADLRERVMSGLYTLEDYNNDNTYENPRGN